MAPPKYENLVDMFERSVKAFGQRPLFGTKRGGRWEWTTYAEVGAQVDAFRSGLSALGVNRGDKVAIIANNRVEWAVAAYACFGIGASLVPMYEAQLAKEWAFICNDCSATTVIAATDEIYQKCLAVKENVPSLTRLIGLSLPSTDPLSYAALLEAGARNPSPAIHADPKDPACLVYTSGTTGDPKGVILSHGNLISNINAVQGILPFSAEDRSLSFLPWAHSFGQTCELHVLISCGASIGLCEAIDKIVANLGEVQPTVLMSVPRIFNKIYDAVNKQMAARPPLVQKLFQAGLKAAAKQKKGQSLSIVEKATLAVADKVVFTKIRARFGGRLKYAFSGASALSREVGEFIDCLGITVYEGYGLTETSPISSANYPGSRRIGSVGQPIPDVKVTIDKAAASDPTSGEIIIHGPNVMIGYHNRPDENKAVFTEDGGLRTGDLGYLDDDGFLYITGRLKEQYKLENGKYVAPAPLEEQLKLSPFIVNAMIYGDNRPYNVALVIPDMDALESWASGQGISIESSDSLLENAKVKEKMQAEVDKAGSEFKGFEKVKRIALGAEDFTTQNGMLTPSLKVKRRAVWQKYGPAITALYAESKPSTGKAVPAAVG